MSRHVVAKIDGRGVSCKLVSLWSHGFEVAFNKEIIELKDKPTVIKVELRLERV